MSNTHRHQPHETIQDAPALDVLARRYLDLWQDQWSALAADPGMADMVARSFAMMGPAAAGFAGFANMLANANLHAAANTHYRANRAEERSHGNHSPASPGAPAAAAAPQYSPDHMAELFNRLASMEQRLADLASHLATPGRGAGNESGPG